VSRPVASIVTTAYMTPVALLRISIDSVLRQSLSDIELVLVIDGQLEPEAEDMVNEFAEVDERVTVIRPGRVGRGPALNIGLKAARGDLVGIQDADDASHVDRLRCQSALFEADPDLALLGTRAQVSRSLTARADWSVDPDEARVHVLDRELLRSNPMIHSSMLARASVLESVGGYDERRRAQFDYDLLLRLRNRGEKIGICELPLVMHRRHPHQTFEGLPPASRAWSSYRLQSSHVADLPLTARVGYQGIATARLVYQVARGIVWHRISHRQEGRTPSETD
jgi:glycosyltransferase involved in cell wall biosynthesis